MSRLPHLPSPRLICVRKLRDLFLSERGIFVVVVSCTLTLLIVQKFDADPQQILDLGALSGMDRREAPAVKSAMRYVSSKLHQGTCAGLRSKTLSNRQDLRLIHNLFGSFMGYPTGSGSSRNSSGGGGSSGSGRAPLPEENFCQDLRTKRGFDRWPVTLQEEQFPLAFGFKIHKSPEMFVRQLSALWRPHNVYCVHVDLKSPPAFFQFIANVSKCFDNVILAPRRRVLHADITSLQADVECAEVALRSPVKWRYHISVCGMEFPLKTNLEMVQILSALNGTNDIENYPASDRVKLFYENKARLSPFKHKDVVFKKGSAYNAVTRQFLQWALHGDQVNLDFLEWLNGVTAPDEFFWATLGGRDNAPGGPRVRIRHDRDEVITKAVNWAWDPYQCRGFYLKSVCVFSAFDLPWLLQRHELIANKFDPDKDSLVLDCLEQELERRALSGHTEVVSAASGTSRTGHQSLSEPDGAESRKSRASPEKWPLVSSLKWSLYRSLPQFPGSSSNNNNSISNNNSNSISNNNSNRRRRRRSSSRSSSMKLDRKKRGFVRRRRL